MTSVQEKNGRREPDVRARDSVALLKKQIMKLEKHLKKYSEDFNADRRCESALAHVRQIQKDPKWAGRLRAQYTKDVSRRTLEINDEFPLHVE